MPDTNYHFNKYQDEAIATAAYPEGFDGLTYVALKLNGEAGEFAEKIGKLIRDKGLNRDTYDTFFDHHNSDLNLLIKELGDVLWYVSAAAHELGISMEEVAQMNIEKLRDRQQRGVINGSGDNR